jgi:hypothetical protein
MKHPKLSSIMGSSQNVENVQQGDDRDGYADKPEKDRPYRELLCRI